MNLRILAVSCRPPAPMASSTTIAAYILASGSSLAASTWPGVEKSNRRLSIRVLRRAGSCGLAASHASASLRSFLMYFWRMRPATSEVSIVSVPYLVSMPSNTCMGAGLTFSAPRSGIRRSGARNSSALTPFSLAFLSTHSNISAVPSPGLMNPLRPADRTYCTKSFSALTMVVSVPLLTPRPASPLSCTHFTNCSAMYSSRLRW